VTGIVAGCCGSPQPLAAAVQTSSSGLHTGPLARRVGDGLIERLRHLVNHFGCFSPEHIDRVSADQVDFLADRI
jgi:hypothetical protein